MKSRVATLPKQLLVVLLWAGPWSAVVASTRYVSIASTNPVSPFETWETAATNIQDALSISVSGDTVIVSNGLYNAGSVSVGGAATRVLVGSGVTLSSVNGPYVTIIGGSSAARGAYVSAGASLNGFTVRYGLADSPALGGGVYLEAGGTVSNCVLHNNSQRNSFNTRSPGGGGVYMHGGGRVVRCIIYQNGSSQCGGGIAVNGNGTILNSAIYGNSAFIGGGVYARGSITMVNCTLSGNAGASGQGLSLEIPGDIALYNNMIYGNSTGPEWGMFLSSLPASSAWYNCTSPEMGIHCVTNRPTFVDPGNANYRLVFGSAGVDHGTNMPGNELDLDGLVRPVDGDLDGTSGWDIGAYEYLPPTNPPVIAITSPQDLSFFPTTTTNVTIQGTASNLMGWMEWTNLATHASGTILAGSPWAVAGVGLTTGTNEWRISGSNASSRVTQAVVRIIRGGEGMPQLTILTTNSIHPFRMIEIIGSNNEHVAGSIVWTNLANGLSDSLPVSAATWTAFVPGLAAGPNPFVFIATNLVGMASSASVTITRTEGAVHYVAPTGSSQPPYTNWATAATNLLMAMAVAIDGDEVVVTGGTWYVAGGLYITNGIVLRSVPGTMAMIRPPGHGRCVIMNHKYALLDGFRVQYAELWLDEGDGAGIYCLDGTIQNCVVSLNYAGDGVGGVLLVKGRMLNCTISRNHSLYFGEGVGVRCLPGASVINCIARYNNPHGHPERNVGGGGTFIACATIPSIGTGCITNDPKFVDVGGDNFRLAADSPCIDTGIDLGLWTKRDLEGFLRPLPGPGGPPAQYDIGAQEFIPIITARTGSHGSISPSGEVAVAIGSTTSFVIAADAYYHITSLLTNGIALPDAAGHIIFTSVWENVQDHGRIRSDFAEDVAAQGTPCWWLAQYGLTNGGYTFDQAETNNIDDDPFTAQEEYICDTDPTTPLSSLCVTAIVANTGVKICFNSSSNRVYTLYRISDLKYDGWTNLPSTVPHVGTGGADTITDTNAFPMQAYRLSVQLR